MKSISLLVAFVTACCPYSTAATRPPNLIVIMTDDQGYADVGFNGCKDIPTPALDSIAANGVNFTNGYVSYTVCSPSRAGFLTGRYQQRFGHERNPRYEPESTVSGLPLSETTIADALGKVGYKCGLVGKWHLGAHDQFHPTKRGFDEFFGHRGGGHRYFPEDLTIRNPHDAKTEEESYRLWIERGHEPVKTTQYLTDEFSDEALRFVERHQGGPFFLYLAYNAPHAPLQASDKHLSRFAHIKNQQRKTYAAMLSAVDDGIGRLLAKLRELRIEENTIVFFLSDNGGAESANASDNGPLRGGKSDAWEGGFRVPFAAQWPGRIPKGLVYDKPVISLDIFATIAARCGAKADPERPLDGVDLMPFLTGENKGVPHQNIYLRMFDAGKFAIRHGDHKLVIEKTGAAPQLFNLEADPGETRNLAGQLPEKVAEIEKLRAAWNAQLVEPVFEGLKYKPQARKRK